MDANGAILFRAFDITDGLRPFGMGRDPVRLESVMEDRWLSVDEIAAYLGIKRDTVYKWISEKQMPAHRMGRLWKFRKEEVDEWVKTGGAAESDSQNSDTGKK